MMPAGTGEPGAAAREDTVDPGVLDEFRDPTALPLASERKLSEPRAAQWQGYVIGAGMVGYGIMVVFGVVSGTFELIDAIPLIPILALVTSRIANRLARADGNPATVRFILAAFWAKMLGSLVRAAVTAWYYGNRSDALDYHRFGQAYAPQFRTFDFSAVPDLKGSNFMRFMTGVIYAVTGSSSVSGAIVLSFLSFLGSILLWRAFKRAVPGGEVYRYGLLIFFLPSLLYWPAALGKEGWALLCLGVLSYGVALAVTGNILPGVLLFLAGVAGVVEMRPHVALVAFFGVLLAAIVGRARKPGSGSLLLRVILFAGLAVLGVMLFQSTSSFFGVESIAQEGGANAAFANAEGRTSEAGSAFSPVTVGTNPLKYPLAAATVLFRPFPFEVGNPIAALTALEGVFLIVLAVRERARLRSIGRQMRRSPYVAYCLGTVLMFIYAFSALSNFGILARQRCQVLPFFLVLLCLPRWEREGFVSTDEAIAGRDVPAAPIPDLVAPSPYDLRVDRADSGDPYAGADLGTDPYERFLPRRPAR